MGNEQDREAGPKTAEEFREGLFEYELPEEKAEREAAEAAAAESSDADSETKDDETADATDSPPVDDSDTKDDDSSETQARVVDEEGGGEQDEGKPDEAAEPESKAEEPTKPDETPESDAEKASAEEPKPEEDPVLWERDDGTQLTLADLYESGNLEAFQADLTELRESGMRQKAFTQKTQELANAHRALESREAQVAVTLSEGMAAIQDAYRDPDMVELLAEFGGNTDIVTRILFNPKDTRALLGSQALKDRLRTQLEAVRDNPELVASHQRAQQAERTLAQRTQQDELQAQETRLVDVANALQQTITAYSAEYPNVDAEAVERSMVELGGITMEDVEKNNLETLIPGLQVLDKMFVVTRDGRDQINPALIEREFKRLDAMTDKPSTESTGDEASDTEASAADSSENATDQHNAEVDKKLAEPDPAPVPAGGDAGDDSQPEGPTDYRDVRKVWSDRLDESRAG
jgi:hypothetical protein